MAQLKNPKMFVGERYNILYWALHKAAYCESYDDTCKMYDFLENTARGPLTTEIIDALDELGYEIVKKEN